MEDTGLFTPTLKYIMITPPIYLLFGAFGVFSLVVAKYIEAIISRQGLDNGLQKLWLIQAVWVLIYTLLWAIKWDQVIVFINPIWVAIFVAANHWLIRAWVARRGDYDARDMVLLYAFAPGLLAVAYILKFMANPWSSSAPGIPESFVLAPLLAIFLTGMMTSTIRWTTKEPAEGLRPFALHAVAFGLVLGYTVGASSIASMGSILALIIGFAIIAYGVRNLLIKKKVSVTAKAVYLLPVNMLLVVSQLMDGFATSLGLDLAGYSEKHVLSAYIIDAFRDFSLNAGWEFGATYPTFLAFVPVKLLVSLLVVWAIDIYSKEDVQKHPTMIGLVKFAIIMVGMGPAVRDFVRLSLGV